MKMQIFMSGRLLACFIVGVISVSFGSVQATEPCGDFGECKVLVEINSTDGDIGFHFLMDGDDLIRAAIYDPRGRKIFKDVARGPLRRQFLTETFAESAEPLCWEDPEADEEDLENIVTLEDFIDRWRAGTYHFVGLSPGWEISRGESRLSFELPAAPKNLKFKQEEEDGDVEGEISWKAGNDLGNCADRAAIRHLLDSNVLQVDPKDVPVASWEVVFEPVFDEDDPNAALSLKYVVRIAAGDDVELEVEVPDDYLETLPDDTEVKVEVGAIGFDDNATFTEVGGFCVNEDEGCGED